jgi:xylulokinase
MKDSLYDRRFIISSLCLDSTSPLLLAIDLGTSGVKASLFTSSGERVRSAFAPTQLLLLPNGGVEQCPLAWWQAVECAVGEILETALRHRVSGICCTGQWSGTVALDRKGIPLGNAILWMDSRGAPSIAALIRGMPSVQGYSLRTLVPWIRKTGGLPGKSGKDSLAHILYLRDKEGERYRQTAMFLEPKDYLNYKLTGRYGSSYDTMALHWVTDNRDITCIRYDEALLAQCGLDGATLPPLYPSTHVLGLVQEEIALRWGISPQTPVFVGSPDLHAATVGSGAVEDYQAHLYLGTSSWITCHVPFKKTSFRFNMATLPAALPGKYFVANSQESAGICLQHVHRLLFSQELETPEAYAAMEAQAAKSPPGSHGLVFTPWINGERGPLENHRIRGGFHHLALHHRSEDLLRAVYEGVALNSRWLLAAVESFVGRRLDPIHVIGGGVRSNLWCQIHADALNRTLLRVDMPLHANARGAAWIAAHGLGWISPSQMVSKIERVFVPEKRHQAVYQERVSAFQRLWV